MLEMVRSNTFTYEKVIEKMCHAPAILYRVNKRGFIRPGYFADLVLVDPTKEYTVNKDNILYHCAWSPFEGTTFSHQVYQPGLMVNLHTATAKSLKTEEENDLLLIFKP